MIKRFNRYELKYVLLSWQVEKIIEDLAAFATPDSYGGASGYRIASLYYDSPTLDCFWAKIDGIRFRRKLRLRVYVGDDITQTTRGMVEIKQRVNRTVQKRRLELPLPLAEQLCEGTLEPTDLDELDQEVASEVQYLVQGMHLRPTCITAYHRRAFTGNRYDSGLRITFDSDLRGRVHALRINEDAENKRIAPPDWSIMEVKCDEAIPDWVTSLLARHYCTLQRVSKYCATLAQLTDIVTPTASFPIPKELSKYGRAAQRARESK